MKKLNNDLSLLKILFTFVIVWYHFYKIVPDYPRLFPRGYLGVEFFFILSGYFMASSIVRNQAKGIEQCAFQFTLHKIKLIYPHLIAGFIINFLIYNLFVADYTIIDSCTSGIFSIGELSFINLAGLKMTKHFYNGPAWYINAMMLAVFLLYPLAKKDIKKFGNYWGG